MISCLLAALVTGLMADLAALAATPGQAQEPERRLVLVGHGRFAVFIDLDSIRRDGPAADARALQVAEEGFMAGDRPYWGGWSNWRFDCEAQTTQRLDFASVSEGGLEGPATPVDSPAIAAAPGGDAHELMTVACNPADAAADARSVKEAVILGRALMAE